MGFTPQFVDLNKDGRMDIITGQYYGHVSWFQGVSDGFDDGSLLDQEGDPDACDWKLTGMDDIKSQGYWLYSTANFGDFDDDGLLDMIVGGSSLRISKNTGTKSQPKFAYRKLLLDLNGEPLKVLSEFTLVGELTVEEKEQALKYSKRSPGGTGMISPLVVDWDNDRVLDLMATNSYTQKGMPAIVFFKGVKTADGHRFEQGIPLFKGKNGSKELPGRWLHINVADWNNDGINDLLIGTSVVTLHDDVFNSYLSWNWESETGVQKNDPGNMKNYPKHVEDYWVQKYLETESTMTKIPAEDYRTMRHRGYIYVMLGEKNDEKTKKTK